MVRPTPLPSLAFGQEILGFDDRQGVLLDVDIWFVIIIDGTVAASRWAEPLHHQLYPILDRGWLRIVRGSRQHRHASHRRALADEIGLNPWHDSETGAGRDELADDHVLLQPAQVVDLAVDRGFGQ